MKQKKNSSDFWDDRYSKASGIQKEPSSFILEQLSDLPKGAQVLDLACGTGRNAVALALKSFKLKGIDFSEVAIQKAKAFAAESQVDVEFKKMDLDFFIPELMSFDAIVISDFKPQPTLMGNLIRGLKKNGKLVVEAHLTKAMKSQPELEIFECFHSGELLRSFQKPAANFQVIFYSELMEDRVQLVLKKTEML